MRAFFIGMQFLTRLAFVKQDKWTELDFGQSVKYFPLIGAVLGSIYAGIVYLLYIYLPSIGVTFPVHLSAVIILVIPLLLTGGLHCDGFMDTMDGLFSGRSRERMLEIMKDSRVGSNGVVGFCLFLLVEWAIIIDMSADSLVKAVFLMPIIARMMMVGAIKLYKYARPEGMGKAFAEYSGKETLWVAFFTTCGFIAVSSPFGVIPFLISIVFSIFFANYATSYLGGLTGDVYGAITTLNELLVLFVFLIMDIVF